MRNMIKILAIFAVILGFAASSYGQSDATASSTAVLITPLSITHTSLDDLDFATLASSATAGTAVITPTDGSMDLTGGDGGLTLISGTSKDATFTVTGQASRTVTVTFTNSTVVLSGGSGDNLNVSSFKYAVDGVGELSSGGSATIPTGGSFALTVGGTLTVPANHESGTYTNAADLIVTVNYQ